MQLLRENENARLVYFLFHRREPMQTLVFSGWRFDRDRGVLACSARAVVILRFEPAPDCSLAAPATVIDSHIPLFHHVDVG